MKNSSYYIAPARDRTHDLPLTVASNMFKVSHALNHLATVIVCNSHVDKWIKRFLGNDSTSQFGLLWCCHLSWSVTSCHFVCCPLYILSHVSVISEGFHVNCYDHYQIFAVLETNISWKCEIVLGSVIVTTSMKFCLSSLPRMRWGAHLLDKLTLCNTIALDVWRDTSVIFLCR